MTAHRELLERHNFALIDRAAVHHRPWHDSLPMVPLAPEILPSDEAAMPALLALEPDAPYLDVLERSLIAAEENPSWHLLSCLLVVAPEVGPDDLADHLTSRLILDSPKGKVLLRYYDHRVFPHLVRTLSPAQLQALFGPEEQVWQWTYRFQNEWITVPAPEITEGVPLYWQVDARTREKLEYTGLINTVLRKRSQHLKRPWQDWKEYENNIDPAEAAIVLGQHRYRLSAPDDLAAFGLHALNHGADFHLYPFIQRILCDETRRKPGDYAFATECLTHDEWAEIVTETPLEKYV